MADSHSYTIDKTVQTWHSIIIQILKNSLLFGAGAKHDHIHGYIDFDYENI